MNSEPQIGFLFLTRGELNNIDLWEKYFLNANPNHYKLLIHPKDPNSLISSLWRSPNSTILRPIPTSWGNISLVKATLYLLQVSLKFPNIKKFILLSESCIPTCSFQSFYQSTIQSPNSFLHWVYGVNIDRLKIVNKSLSVNIPNNLWAKQSQWMLLDRKHVDLLFNNGMPHNRSIQFLNSMTYCPAPDEHFFINYFLYICRCDIKSLTNLPVTFVDWTTGTQHPMLFNTINKELIELCRNKNLFFARKFNTIQNINNIFDDILELKKQIDSEPISNNEQYTEKEIIDIIQNQIDTDENKQQLTETQLEILKLLNKNTITYLSDNQLNKIYKILTTEDPVNPTEEVVNPTEDPVNSTEDPVNPTEDPVNSTEDPVNSTEEVVNSNEKTVNPNEELVNPTEEVVNPTEDPVNPTEEVVNPTEELVNPTEELVNPTEEVVNSNEEN